MDYTTQYSTKHVNPERRQSARSFLDTKPVCPSHYSWLSNTKLSLYVTVSAAIFHDSVQSHHDQRSLCVVRTIEPNTSARSKLRVHRVLPSGKQGIQDIKLWYSSHKVSHVISSSRRLSSLISHLFSPLTASMSAPIAGLHYTTPRNASTASRTACEKKEKTGTQPMR